MYVASCHSVYKNVAERPRARPSGGPRPSKRRRSGRVPARSRSLFPPRAALPAAPVWPCASCASASCPALPAAGRDGCPRASVPRSIIGELGRGLAAPSLASSSSVFDGRTEQVLPRVWAQVSSSRFSLTDLFLPSALYDLPPLLPTRPVGLCTHAHTRAGFPRQANKHEAILLVTGANLSPRGEPLSVASLPYRVRPRAPARMVSLTQSPAVFSL